MAIAEDAIELLAYGFIAGGAHHAALFPNTSGRRS